MEYTLKQLSHIDRDGSFSVKNGQVHYGYKDHTKLDVDNHLIRDYDVTTASDHDGNIDLIEKEDVAAYRDKGYFVEFRSILHSPFKLSEKEIKAIEKKEKVVLSEKLKDTEDKK